MKRGRVVHAVPGRVRIKLQEGELDQEAGEELRSALTAMPGVDEVRVNHRTASVVIQYDRGDLDVEGLRKLARAANLLALDAGGADLYGQARPPSLTAQRIKRTFGEVDARLAEITNGRWDLRSVVPMLFGAMALRQIVRDFGQLQAAPWYVLAWYAFDSFWKLNEQHRRSEASADVPPLERDGE